MVWKAIVLSRLLDGVEWEVNILLCANVAHRWQTGNQIIVPYTIPYGKLFQE